MKRNKKDQKLEDMLQLYIRSVLLDFDNPETISTLKKAAGLISQPKRIFLKKA
jgi:hypothetical protein